MYDAGQIGNGALLGGVCMMSDKSDLSTFDIGHMGLIKLLY